MNSLQKQDRDLPAYTTPNSIEEKAKRLKDTFSEQLAAIRDEGKGAAFKKAIDLVADRYDVEMDRAEYIRVIASLQFCRLSAEEALEGARFITDDPALGERYQRWNQNIDGGHFREAVDRVYKDRQTKPEADRLTAVHDLNPEWWRRVSNREDGENWKYIPPPDKRRF